ncbi:MAG: beta-lactamase family protein [Desulfobacterales bacterium]|jgi:CubicO group peptidase (beta-lactamase class C family)|nr:beta-lactamase family protein [Desulfobacterales bacterium]
MIQVDRIMRRGVDDGVFPGAVLRVGRGENVLFHAAYGHANRFTGEPVTPGTVFDLASLTKPLATTLAVMRLCQQRRLGVEQRLASVLPAFEGGGKGGVTIAQLLAHTSGLPDYRPFYLELAARPAPERKNLLRARLVQEPLLYAPGERMLYSDLDFMILEWVVETVSGRRLDRYAAEEVYAPLGAADALFFIDLDRPAPPRACAATEQCPWRGRLIEAEVHDENAHALGGIAGHAGLFGTAEGIHRVLSELLNAYHRQDGGRLFDRLTVHRFFQRVPGTDKALGFDMPAPVNPSCGRFFPPTGIGHLGFTGTSFWVHLEQSVAVILLTNRVHPGRANIAIRGFRPVIHDAVMEAVGTRSHAAAP